MLRTTLLLTVCVLLAGLAMSARPVAAEQKKEVPAVLDFTMKRITGEEIHLGQYAGKVVLIVNTASKCGATPQYKTLQALHEKYSDKGLAILGFPANEFGNQEPGSNEEIADFCEENYGVKFDMFQKVVVKGDGICPLYAYLTGEKTNPQFAGEVKWNFEKFLIDRDGNVVGRYRTKVQPDSEEVIKAIEAALAAK